MWSELPPDTCPTCIEVHSCWTCHDGGFVRVTEAAPAESWSDARNRDNRIGRAIPCPGCTDKGRDEVLEVERLNIPLAFAECRLATWLPENGRPRLAAQSYAVNWPPAKPFLLLSGDTGRGKTHLAIGVMFAVWERHKVRSRFWPVVDLLARYRATFDKDRATETTEEIDRELERCPLLVLDDLGAQKDTEWAEEQLFRLIDRRHRDRKPTVVTTNLGEIQLPARLKSRLADQAASTVVHLDGTKYPDHRTGKIG